LWWRLPVIVPGYLVETLVGSFAAFCTTISYVPQIYKCWKTGHTGDLSFKMFAILALGIGSWVVYGVLKGDPVIIVANGTSLALLGVILFFKLRERKPTPSSKGR
jgi:MtN3 and saliva related transmembrane protein